jgi:hypothetical protein
MSTPPLLLLRTWGRMPATELLDRMRVSRPTMMRAVREHRDEIIVRGNARRTAYAARREIRGVEGVPYVLRLMILALGQKKIERGEFGNADDFFSHLVKDRTALGPVDTSMLVEQHFQRRVLHHETGSGLQHCAISGGES